MPDYKLPDPDRKTPSYGGNTRRVRTDEEKEIARKGKAFYDMTDEEKEAYSPSSSHLKRFPRKGEPGYEENRRHIKESYERRREQRQREKNMRSVFLDLFRAKVDVNKMDNEMIKAFMAANGLSTDAQTVMAVAMIMRAIGGDVEAFKAARDTSGNKPVDGLVITNQKASELSEYDMKHLSTEELMQLAENEESEESEELAETEDEDEDEDEDGE